MSFIIGLIVVIAIIAGIFVMIKQSDNMELKASITLLMLSGVGLIAGSVLDESKIILITKYLFIGSIVALVVAIIKILFN